MTTPAGARTNLEITPVNIGAVAKTGDTMTGRLEMSLNANDNQARITFSCPNVAGPVQLVGNATGTQQRVTFRQYTPDGTTFEEYALPNTADYTGGPVLMNILTDKSPVTIGQGGTGMTGCTPINYTGLIESDGRTRIYSWGMICVATIAGFPSTDIISDVTPILSIGDSNYFPSNEVHSVLTALDGTALRVVLNSNGQMRISHNVGAKTWIYGQIVWFRGV